MKKTYMEARPTPSMKKCWLCRTSCDEKNHEIEPVMIQQWWSRSSDYPYPVLILQWWSRSSDDLDPTMIEIEWWSRWRWWEIEDDLDDTEKNTCVVKLCRENTFLVKRECWCNCNFRMYSLVFLMYCNLMFIPGCICNVLESCHAPMFLSGVSIM